MKTNIHVEISEDIVPKLLQFLEQNQMQKITLVCDSIEYDVLGSKIESNLRQTGFYVDTVILKGDQISANEHYITQVLLRAPQDVDAVFVSVGSGTVTDLTRFVAHQTRNRHIVIPTAPSVDGFAASGSALTVGRFKIHIEAQPPIAIFADLKTLCAAPREMIAAGFGDMIGKFTAVSDWKLAHLIMDEPYNQQVAEKSWKAMQNCVQRAKVYGQNPVADVRILIKGLIDEGICMKEAGNSLPASGSEHHISHFWEMKLLQEDRPPILHGVKVGIGTVLIARYYELIRGIPYEVAAKHIDSVRYPDLQSEIEAIRHVYGQIADQIIKLQTPYLSISRDAFNALKRKIIDNWPQIQQIASLVPSSNEIEKLIREVGGFAFCGEVGLGDGDVDLAIGYAHYIRRPFNIRKLCHLMGFYL